MTAGAQARSDDDDSAEPRYRNSPRCLLRIERDGPPRLISASKSLAALLQKQPEGMTASALLGTSDQAVAALMQACLERDDAIEVDLTPPVLGPARLVLMPQARADAADKDVLAIFVLLPERPPATDELERKNAALIALTDELRQAQIAAEDSNRAKSRFLAHMSHELRTPLNGIIGFADIMRAGLFGPVEPERYRDYVELIHNSGGLLLSLINDILDMSKIEAGKMELNIEPLETATLAESCRTMVIGMARDNSVVLKVEIEPGCTEIHADERAAKQMIINLMSNAVKFTPAGGVVTLSFRKRGAPGDANGGVAISVADNGIGMTPEELQKAMLPFGQVDSELARQRKGSGIGLTLVKSLAELHGGTLDIVSAKNLGTTATLNLPWMKAA